MRARRLRLPGAARVWMCALFVVVCAGLPAAATPARADDAGRFSGTWEHVGGDSEQAGLLDAIEHCVAELNFLIRPLARSRLVASSPIPSQVVIEAKSTQVSVQQGVGPALSSRLGSVSPITSADGNPVELSYRMQEDALVQRIVNSDGARQTVYRLDPEGSRLIAEITTSSRFFSHALVYTLTFERVPQLVSRGPTAPLTSSQ